jgi:hypothetical protein
MFVTIHVSLPCPCNNESGGKDTDAKGTNLADKESMKLTALLSTPE